MSKMMINNQQKQKLYVKILNEFVWNIQIGSIYLADEHVSCEVRKKKKSQKYIKWYCVHLLYVQGCMYMSVTLPVAGLSGCVKSEVKRSVWAG